MRAARTAYPLKWRIMDALEGIAAAIWPARFRRATPYLMLLPAVLLVG
ncbi:MAG: ABC transporter permease, partial [Mesorhizobium sp.]